MTDIGVLEEQERRIVLDRFDHDAAWALGLIALNLARQTSKAVAVDVRRPGLVLFRATTGGVTADIEEWIRRKSAVTLRFEASSHLVTARMKLWDIAPGSTGWLDSSTYALSGGSVPIRVAGSGVVGAITVSGLTDEEDHDIAVAALEQFKKEAGL